MVALGQPAWFPVFGLFASSICFAVHWKGLDSLTRPQVRWISFSWFFLIQLVQLSWLTAIEYQGFYILFVYVLLAAAIGAQFSFLTGRLNKQSNLDIFTVFSIAALWTILEWMRLHVLCGCAFNFVGVFLSGNIFSLQVASLSGILGMSFWVMVTNLLGLKMLQRVSFSRFSCWIGAALLPFVYGFIQISYQDALQEGQKMETCSALLLQPGLTPSQKYLLAERQQDFIPIRTQWNQILAEIARYKEKKVDLIVLPEAVVPFGLNGCVLDLEWVKKDFFDFFGAESLNHLSEDSSIQKKILGRTFVSSHFVLQGLANFMQVEVLAGLDLSKQGQNYNSAVFFSPRNELQHYDKRVLLPLAEYMPFAILQRLSQWYGIQDFFTPGVEAKVFGKFSISPSICYDELFSSLMREGKKKGAKVFVNITNDGWYPSSRLPEQHFTHGLIRSVENGVPSVRACNTGVTAIVDSVGRVVARLEKPGEASSRSLWAEFSLCQHATVFSFLGETPLLFFCFLLTLIFLIKENYFSLSICKNYFFRPKSRKV